MVTVCINSFPLAKLKTALSCISAKRKKILSFSIYSSSRCLHKNASANFQLSMSFSLPVYLQTYLYEYKQGFELSSNKPKYCPVLLSIHPENTRETKGFLIFSGDIGKQHRAVMG